MPIERDRYAPNWPDLSIQVKRDAGWRCQCCGRQCRKPGESIEQFVERIGAGELAIAAIQANPQRWTLTTAHLDQDPGNDDPENLAALCTTCHLQHDRRFLVANRYAKRERQGQLRLLEAI